MCVIPGEIAIYTLVKRHFEKYGHVALESSWRYLYMPSLAKDTESRKSVSGYRKYRTGLFCLRVGEYSVFLLKKDLRSRLGKSEINKGKPRGK